MRNDWKIKGFEDCLQKVKKQKAVKSKCYLDNGLYPIVSQESDLISGYTNEEKILYKHEKPVIIFGDHTKNIKYVDFDFVVGADGVHILYVNDDILPKFFYYELCSIQLRNLGYARHYKLLKEKEIGYPNLSEQERIVSLLDTQFAKIDALKANAAYQLQAAKDLFQAALKQLLTPKEGWDEKTLGSICISIKDGDWIEKKDQSPTGIRLLQTGNIGVGIYKDKSDSPHYISLDTFNRLHCEEVFAGDILLSRLPEPVGRACLVPKMEGRFITAVDCSIIKVHTEKVTPEYLIYYTQTNAYFKSISSLCTGTTRQRISRKKLEEVSISFPSLPEQERIAARLDEISEKVRALQSNYDQTITLCNDLKQALLKSIFG